MTQELMEHRRTQAELKSAQDKVARIRAAAKAAGESWSEWFICYTDNQVYDGGTEMLQETFATEEDAEHWLPYLCHLYGIEDKRRCEVWVAEGKCHGYHSL